LKKLRLDSQLNSRKLGFAKHGKPKKLEFDNQPSPRKYRFGKHDRPKKLGHY
jgi:hypothetical protein